MTTTLDRTDIQKISNDPKVIRAIEDLFKRISTAEGNITAGADATQGINNATVVVLSPNDAFGNERVLAVSQPLALNDAGPGGNITIGFGSGFQIGGGFALTLNLLADTSVTLPTDGDIPSQPFPGPYANDAAAAADGVPVSYVYRKSDGTVVWRQT